MFRSILLFAGLCFAQTYDLRGVEIYSKSEVHFGRWEIRMKAAATPGTVSSFFTYYPNSYLDSPYPWREIDIEVLGKNGKVFQSNLITGTAGAKVTSEKLHTFASDLSQTFHTYTLEWTPDSVVWRLDGANVRSISNSSQQVVDLRDSSHTYRMNLWASNSPAWAGALDTSKLPVLQVIRWMRYSAYTPGAGPGGSSFTPSWTDSFKTINTARWAFGDWTFDGNYATFSSANAKVQDGHLVMMLSTAGKMGQFPSTFPHDTAGTSGVKRPDASTASTSNCLVRERRGVWITSLSSPALEAFDLRGQRIARGTPSAGGQTLDLRGSPRQVVLVRQGALSSWTILANE
jgi:hypothetical protein